MVRGTPPATAASNSETLPNTFERQMSALRVSVRSYAQWTSRATRSRASAGQPEARSKGRSLLPGAGDRTRRRTSNPADPNASTRTDPR